MAARYWVGGNANWDATAGTKWATTSGGAGGAAVPTAADDVFLDNGAGTGNVTIPAATTVVCRSLDCTGYVSTLTFAATTSVVTIGDATAGAGNAALTFVAGMTLTLTAVGSINFVSTSATQQTITTNGKTVPSMSFGGTGSSYLFSDAVTQSSTGTLTVTNGVVNFNALTHTFGAVVGTGAAARTLTLTNATLNIIGSATTAWNFTTITNLTFSATGSTINFTGSGSTLGALTIIWGALTIPTVNFAALPVLTTWSTSPTITNLSLTASANQFNEIRVGSNMTITNLTINGNSVVNRGLIRSNTMGTTRTLTVGSITTNGFWDWIDITAAGAATWSDSGWGVLRATGITGATPVNTYYVGGTGASTDATKYASTSGGTANTQRAPLLQDSAFYDANSGTGTLSLNSSRIGDIDFTNTALTSVTLAGGFDDRFFAGNFILSNNAPITFSGFSSAIVLCGSGSETLTMANTTVLIMSFAITCTGTYTLGSDITLGSSITLAHNLGTFTTNNYNISCGVFTNTAGTINLGSSIITITSSANVAVWTVAAATTLNAGTSSIYVSGTATSNQNFAGGGKSYYMLYITYNGTGLFTFTGATNNTFAGILCYGTPSAKTIRFTSATTTTLLSNTFPFGTSGNIVTIQSVTAASAFTLAYTGTVTTDYISLKDSTASGGINFYAGASSTNVSGNTNWTFARSTANDNQFFALARQ